MKNLWTFTDRINEERPYLNESITFEEIAEQIDNELVLLAFEVERGKEFYLRCCLRPEFTFRVEDKTFDLFFNSPFGYRAQYYIDAEEGQKQNNRLIARLADRLIRYSADKETREYLSEEQIRKSLIGCSARIWINQDNFQFNLEVIKHIDNPSWQKYIEQDTNKKAKRKAIWGIRAPTGNKLEIKGAFLDPDENEVVHIDKIGRRFEIQRYGFS